MGTIWTKHAWAAWGLAFWLGGAAFAWADDASQDTAAQDAAPEVWSLHGQATFTEQYHPAFTSPYRGGNSLDPASRGDETFDSRCLPACGCGTAARPISIPRSTRVSASATRWAWPAFPAARPTRWARPIPISGCSACSFARVSIWAASPGRRARRQQAGRKQDGKQSRHHRRQILGHGHVRHQ